MEYFYYEPSEDRRSHKKFSSDKFSVLQKQERFYEVVATDEDDFYDEDYTEYVLYTVESNDVDVFMKHSNLVDFLKEYYGCDLIADAYYVSDMGDPYYSWRTYGFFIVRNDVVEGFITDEYAKGLYDYAHNVLPCITANKGE